MNPSSGKPFAPSCERNREPILDILRDCLLYTSDAADERSSVDLGGRRIIKKQTVYVRLVEHTDTTDNDGELRYQLLIQARRKET